MGVSYFNCDYCGSIYADCHDEAGNCYMCGNGACGNCYQTFIFCNICNNEHDDNEKICDECYLDITECVKCGTDIPMCVNCYDDIVIKCCECKGILCKECNSLCNEHYKLDISIYKKLNNNEIDDDTDEDSNEETDINTSILGDNINTNDKPILNANRFFRNCLNCKNIYCTNCVTLKNNLNKCHLCNHEKIIKSKMNKIWNNFIDEF